jgi:predicted ABC-type transport system involved in lysophospholipase L1 biosynthesis ATPase subunit
MADEPTGNLDENNGVQIAELLFELNRKLGTTMIVVTHNPELASSLGRRLELKSGVLHEQDGKNKKSPF